MTTTLVEAQERLAALDAAIATMQRERALQAETVHRLWITDTLLRQAQAADQRRKEQAMRLMVKVAAVWLVLVGSAAAQTMGTSLHRWAWTQSGDRTGLSYEVAVDGQPHAPVLGVTCDTAGNCGGALPVGLAEGPHTARMRAYRIVDGVRLTGPDSNELAFVMVGTPSAPQEFRLVPPAGSVAVNGTVSERPYGFAGLEVAPIALDGGGQLLIAAQRLSVPGYTVQRGERMGLLMVPAL